MIRMSTEMMRKSSKFSASFLPEGFHWASGLGVTWNPTHSGIGNSSQNFSFQNRGLQKAGSFKTCFLLWRATIPTLPKNRHIQNQGHQKIQRDTKERAGRHKIPQNHTGTLCPQYGKYCLENFPPKISLKVEFCV